MKFKPDFNLLTTYKNAERPFAMAKPPYIAVFKKNEKTLIYVATKHYDEKSFDMIDFSFKNWDIDICLVEFERLGTKIGKKSAVSELQYSIYVASDYNVPVVLSDLEDKDILKKLIKINPEYFLYYQLQWVMKNARNYEKQFKKKTTLGQEVENFNHFIWDKSMGKPADEKQLANLFKKEFKQDFNSVNMIDFYQESWIAPDENGNFLNKLRFATNLYARDIFMIENIFEALNKYDTVLAVFGEGHYQVARPLLKEAFDEPEYIKKVNYKDRKPVNTNPIIKELIKV